MILIGLITGITLYVAFKVLNARAAKQKLQKWDNTPRNKVIVHGFPPGKTLANASPFILKLTTYLKMAKIPYELDITDPFGPKGKAPWISVNGKHVADSQLILEFLNKEFGKDLNGKYTDAEIATAEAVRIILEEHLWWGVVMERYILSSAESFKKVLDFPWIIYAFMRYYELPKRMKSQGIGTHSQTEIENIMRKDIKIASTILGNKKFICGDEPCESDAAIFGHLAQLVWGLPDSEYERLIHGEFSNLKEYCERMKTKFWPEWDSIIGSSADPKRD